MSRNEGLVVAVRSLAVLAVHPAGALTTDRLGEILGLNPVVVRRVLGRLRWDGLVETRRGPHGGCALALEPSRIRLGRLDRALRDADELPAAEPAEPAEARMARALGAARGAYDDELDRWTLADLLGDTDPFPGH